MNDNKKFLEALKASLSEDTVNWSDSIEYLQWLKLFKMAELHSVLPLFYEAVYKCQSYKAYEDELNQLYKAKVMNTVILQVLKTSEFLNLYKHLLTFEVKAVVVKGIICRNSYPMPDHRASNDEDIYVGREQFALCHKALLAYGMKAIEENSFEAINEVSYIDSQSGLYIEVHKELFEENSEAYGELNDIFKNAFDNAIEEEINGVRIYTLEYTDHMMYLICHAFKHFLHSGFGIRQLCDVIVYANTYGAKINWYRLLLGCRKINADVFTAALFDIGERYLNFCPDKACYPEEWRNIKVDSEELLLELLDSGLYGDSTMSRKHSSNITLNAVASDKKGKKFSFSVMKTIFPDSKSLAGQYGYLKKYSFLLPVAWMQRIIKYIKEKANRGVDNSAAESIKIGNDRVELFKKYGILRK